MCSALWARFCFPLWTFDVFCIGDILAVKTFIDTYDCFNVRVHIWSHVWAQGNVNVPYFYKFFYHCSKNTWINRSYSLNATQFLLHRASGVLQGSSPKYIYFFRFVVSKTCQDGLNTYFYQLRSAVYVGLMGCLFFSRRSWLDRACLITFTPRIWEK